MQLIVRRRACIFCWWFFVFLGGWWYLFAGKCAGGSVVSDSCCGNKKDAVAPESAHAPRFHLDKGSRQNAVEKLAVLSSRVLGQHSAACTCSARHYVTQQDSIADQRLWEKFAAAVDKSFRVLQRKLRLPYPTGGSLKVAVAVRQNKVLPNAFIVISSGSVMLDNFVRSVLLDATNAHLTDSALVSPIEGADLRVFEMRIVLFPDSPSQSRITLTPTQPLAHPEI